MPAKTFAARTKTRYRGLPVTVVGAVNGPAIAVAGYGTPCELALGVLTGDLEDLERAVDELVERRARNERGA